MPPDETKRTTDHRLLRCQTCQRVVACSPADVLAYTREGWPRCCGEVMELFSPTTPPAPDDTTPDLPAFS